jgi:hypothetical protein
MAYFAKGTVAAGIPPSLSGWLAACLCLYRYCYKTEKVLLVMLQPECHRPGVKTDEIEKRVTQDWF